VARLPEFFTHKDKQSARNLTGIVLAFIGVILLIKFGREALNYDEGEYYLWFEQFRDSSWALPIIILTFIAASFIGLPQWALFAATIVTFGLGYGATYAWVSTLMSASANFWVGKWIGAERLKRYGGDFINRMTNMIRRNGFVASFVVRLVPTGPFVLVNMTAGISHMRYAAFLGGTALGIIPKILVVGLFTQGIVSGAQGDILKLGFVILGLIILGIMFLARGKLQKLIVPKHENDQKGDAKPK